MSRLPRALGAAVLCLVTLAPAAGAFETGTSHPAKAKVHTRGFRVRSTAITLSVAFHGDGAAGCAAHGVCDTSGTVDVTVPAGPGVVIAFTKGGVSDLIGGLARSGVARASVTTAGAAAPCSDTAAIPTMGLAAGGALRPTLVFGANIAGLGTDYLATRCAGPTLEDAFDALPRHRMPRRFLHRHTFRLPLAGTHTFTGGGFAGTVTATGSLTLRRN